MCESRHTYGQVVDRRDTAPERGGMPRTSWDLEVREARAIIRRYRAWGSEPDGEVSIDGTALPLLKAILIE